MAGFPSTRTVGLKPQRRRGDSGQQFVLGVIQAKVEIGRIISQPRRVSEQMAHVDIGPGRRKVREIFGELVVEAELALLNEHHHRSGCELFPNRPGLEYDLGLDCNLMLHVGQPVASRQDGLAVLVDE